MTFAGFDTSGYPGDRIMLKLRDTTNFWYCGYYLAPAPRHSDTSYMGKRNLLQGLGFGILPLYVGEQVEGPGSLHPSPENGAKDGNDAVRLMRGEGFPEGSCVFLDLENGPPLRLGDYVDNWCGAVSNDGFLPGVYCSHLLADDIHRLQPIARIFAFKVGTTAAHPVSGPPYPEPDPGRSGFAAAFVFQHQQNALIAVPGEAKRLKVDLSCARVADPSAPTSVA
jgi:Rv2525c-like, glycoside hydrolase-like domain